MARTVGYDQTFAGLVCQDPIICAYGQRFQAGESRGDVTVVAKRPCAFLGRDKYLPEIVGKQHGIFSDAGCHLFKSVAIKQHLP